MRSGIADREDAIERKFQHDNEQSFKVLAKRNRLFGFWAGVEIGLEGTELESYTTRLVLYAVTAPKDKDIIDSVYKSFREHQVEFSKHQLTKQLTYFHGDAQREFETSIAS